MKKTIFTIAFIAISIVSFGQDNTDKIMLNEDNGVKTLTISKVENGKAVTKTYTNNDAEAKITELEKAGNLSKTIVIGDDGTMYTKLEYTTSTK